MAMDWLKGLVAPVAQFSPTGQPMGAPQGGAFPPGYGPPAGGPPVGGAPPGAWSPPASPGGAPAGSPSYGAGMPGVDANAFGAAYSATPSYGSPPQTASYGTPPQTASYGAPAQTASYGAPATPESARIVALENKCEELRRDLESVALFAQTLLAVLEDKKIMTTQDFQDTRRKLDLLDGRLDDRIAKTPGA